MLRRHELSERKWKLVEPHTRGRGRDNRQFVNAVLYRVHTGCSWRDLPERFGSWNTVARRFRRWAQAGVWQALFEAVQEPDYAWVLIDSITVKAHKAAAGQKKARQQPKRWAAPWWVRHEAARSGGRLGQLPALGAHTGGSG